jgi:tetratricopeptide (TPR) repeat protein
LDPASTQVLRDGVDRYPGDEALTVALGDRSELFRLRAIRAEKSGKLDEAIFNREQYLAHLADPPPLEWNKLADLYTSAGRVEEAARALRQAAETVARSDTAAP